MVEQGGLLSNNKGINRKGGGLTAPALTEKDMQDIKTAAELKADFLGVSFPRSGADIHWARELMHKAGGKALLVAKIERAEAITGARRDPRRIRLRSWSRAAISRSRWATRSCRRCRSA